MRRRALSRMLGGPGSEAVIRERTLPRLGVAIDALRARVRELMPQVRADLEDLTRIPSVSLDSFDQAQVQASAERTAELLRAEPTWTTLLARSWDDGGASFAAAVERAAAEPGHGDVVVLSGLRALALGLGDDGDPAGWTVDRATATSVAPALADAVAARPDAVAEALERAAAGEGQRDRLVLRGLGYASADPDAAVALDRAYRGAAWMPEVEGGYLAVREYGQRLDHALGEFAAQEQAERRMRTTGVITAVTGPAVSAAVAVVSVAGDLDGTWDASADEGQHFSVGTALCEAGGAPGAATGFREVADLLGTPTAPVSPRTDWWGLAADVAPAGRLVLGGLRRGLDGAEKAWDEHLPDLLEAGVGAVDGMTELVDPGSD